jgi:hypothetical protein
MAAVLTEACSGVHHESLGCRRRSNCCEDLRTAALWLLEMGQGSQFKVYLPATEGVATEIEQGVELLQGHGELVLIVDDDLAVQQTNQSLLESYQYTTLGLRIK